MSYSDPRLLMQWYRYAPPMEGALVINVFDAAKDKSGLGVSDGIVSYRDGLGRVGKIPRTSFEKYATELTRDAAQAALPPLEPKMSFIRFPGLSERFKVWEERRQKTSVPKRPSAPRKVRKPSVPKPPAPSGNRKPHVVDVTVRRSRPPGGAGE